MVDNTENSNAFYKMIMNLFIRNEKPSVISTFISGTDRENLSCVCSVPTRGRSDVTGLCLIYVSSGPHLPGNFNPLLRALTARHDSRPRLSIAAFLETNTGIPWLQRFPSSVLFVSFVKFLHNPSFFVCIFPSDCMPTLYAH